MTRTWVFVVVLGCAVRALGQEGGGQPEILVDPNGPGAQHGGPHRVPLPPEGPGREAFLKEFIRVDPTANQAFLGQEALSAYDFYGRVGRPDLAARADERTRQKIWLMAGGVLVLAAGVTAGVFEFENAQNLNDPNCSVNGALSYNACVDARNRNKTLGILFIGSGVVLGAGLFIWGALIPQMVTTPEQTLELAKGYNRALGQKHGAPAARLRLFPMLGGGRTGLVARLDF